MIRRVLVVALAAGATGAIGAPTAAAQSPPVAAARLQGTFVLAGRITSAVAVAGERRGQTFTRSWTFTPQCPVGPCTSVLLTRPRAGGTDLVLLSEQSSGHYTGSGQFYAPLRCRGRTNPRGELVPFHISVVITAAMTAGADVVAGRVNATYINWGRQNLTRCVQPPSHDAASYHGHLT
jgi:hypothetical protein